MTNDPTTPQPGPEGAPDAGGVPPQPPQQPVPPQPQQPGPPQQQPPAAPEPAQQQPVYPPQGQTPPPPGGGYGQPYAQSAPGQGTSNIVLNLWLSVFFSWIPALIFYLIEKDSATPIERKAAADNLNFQLIRIIAMVAAGVLVGIPVLGWLIWVAAVVGGFVISIIHAAKVPGELQAGREAKFLLAPTWVK
ncbi:DUF4870 domain-containing protein [Microbacterium karelineae]|uniref:DUF4870 domain-containing protein n=1 Tax=Microbacterium karelineae TaxID=2654283 RepID=UPI0012EA8E3F|nr:DUF4870 domain-containing protein [Microbacterium karelineae]